MEGDLLGLYLTILHIHLVAAQHDWDVFTHPAARGHRPSLHQTGKCRASPKAATQRLKALSEAFRLCMGHPRGREGSCWQLRQSRAASRRRWDH